MSSIKTKTIEDLRGWCKDSLSRQFEEGKLFKEIDSYCTFKVLDKLGSNAIPETTADDDSKWKTAFDALGKIAEHLGEELEGIKKTQDSGSNNATKVAVKGWCKKMYSETYKGDSDKLFEVAKKVCVSA
ncbi:hypothetical protein MHF_0551 [Mycoplasma haemofelis Ohio2]|uniref:Uncharacterized protein n=1 Tax=Mycoplasma haemofelis (strain Ohio2) TaxID=859194 RepID=F6FHX5_MYCHI|nr:hypothetical protein MHF_0551 [Mycoplasma haemofelis Ohio2]